MGQAQSSSDPVHLISVGPFGEAVGGHLRTLRVDVSETVVTAERTPPSDEWPSARVRIVVAWRPVPSLCKYLDEFSYQRQQPFVPLILDSTLLQLGPLVMPGRGCCWDCSARRSLQHAGSPTAQSALWEYYDANCGAGPRGYLEPFAMMGAAMIGKTIDALDDSAAVPGSIWRIDMLTRKMNTSRAIGIDGCSRCGSGRPAASRGFTGLQDQLSYLWTK